MWPPEVRAPTQGRPYGFTDCKGSWNFHRSSSWFGDAPLPMKITQILASNPLYAGGTPVPRKHIFRRDTEGTEAHGAPEPQMAPVYLRGLRVSVVKLTG